MTTEQTHEQIVRSELKTARRRLAGATQAIDSAAMAYSPGDPFREALEEINDVLSMYEQAMERLAEEQTPTHATGLTRCRKCGHYHTSS